MMSGMTGAERAEVMVRMTFTLSALVWNAVTGQGIACSAGTPIR